MAEVATTIPNGSPSSFAVPKQKLCPKRQANSPTRLPEIKSLAKKFMNDPSVFTLDDPDAPNRGPGSYELPPIIGAKRKGSPPAAHSSQSSSKLLGEDNKGPPGVCYYDPKKEVVLKKSPRIPKLTEDRFRWLGATQDAYIPLLYEEDISTKVKRHGVLLFGLVFCFPD